MARRGLAALVLAAACSTVGAGPVAVTPLGIEARQISQLATSPNGQTVYGVDESRRSIVAIDPFVVGRCREVVGTAVDGRPQPVSLAVLPGDIMAVVCRADDTWSLRTYRTRPEESVDATQSLQEVILGYGDGPETAAMAVSRTRDWFAVVGLPPPLPPVTTAVHHARGFLTQRGFAALPYRGLWSCR